MHPDGLEDRQALEIVQAIWPAVENRWTKPWARLYGLMSDPRTPVEVRSAAAACLVEGRDTSSVKTLLGVLQKEDPGAAVRIRKILNCRYPPFDVVEKKAPAAAKDTKKDTDGDGIPDEVEKRIGTDPRDAGSGLGG